MVLVNKVEEMKNKSVYYAQTPAMPRQAGSQSVLQGGGTIQPMDRPYSVFDPKHMQYYKYVFTKVHYAKMTANLFSITLWLLTFILCCFSIWKGNYVDRKFPASFPLYYTKEWHRMDKLDALINSLTGVTAPADRVRKVWDWGNCTDYITANPIPRQNHPETLVTVSSTDPVYLPGGCNCLAQVAATLPNDFNAAAPHIALSKVRDQFEFCTLFGPMPTTIKGHGRDLRVNTYIYGFLFFAFLAVLASNFRHWAITSYFRQDSKDSDVRSYETDHYYAKLMVVLISVVSFVFVIIVNSICHQCDPELKSIDWVWAALVIALSAISAGYFTWVNSTSIMEQLRNAMKQMGMTGFIDAGKTNKTDAQWTNLLTFSNAKAGEEQLVFDVLLIPALVALTIGMSVLRSWLDLNMILYNITLVVFLACFYTSANYISSKWAVKALDNKDNKNTELDKECQFFKLCAIFAGAFIIFALCFTALPGVQPNYYHLTILDNWYLFISALFLIYIIPDVVNEIWACTLQTMTAMRQWILVIFSFFIIFTQMKAVWFKDDIFVNSVFK